MEPQNATKLGSLEKQPILSPITRLGKGWGGARKNGGRPKGSRNRRTREQALVVEEIADRARKHAHRLYNALMHNAEGLTHMFKIVQRKGKPDEHVLVTDFAEIKMVLDENKGMGGVVEDQYYYITTRDPDNKAIEMLLDRGLGKVKNKVDLTTKDQPIAQPLLHVLYNDSPKESKATHQEN